MSLAKQRINQQLYGREAENEMLRVLKGNDAAQNLARKISSFYGDYLKFIEDTSYSNSQFIIELSHEPVMLRSAEIHLQLSTNRTAEALTHELLHLSLPIQGFPLVEEVSISDELLKYAKDSCEIIQKIVNLVEHELIFPRFIRLGLDRTKFLGHTSPAPKEKELAKKVKQPGYVPDVGFPWWCLEYYRQWISIRHSMEKNFIRSAVRIERWGSKMHPDLPEALGMIRDWTLRGEYKNPNKYPIEMNTLFTTMKLPKVIGWAALKNNEGGKPFAEKLQINC